MKKLIKKLYNWLRGKKPIPPAVKAKIMYYYMTCDTCGETIQLQYSPTTCEIINLRYTEDGYMCDKCGKLDPEEWDNGATLEVDLGITNSSALEKAADTINQFKKDILKEAEKRKKKQRYSKGFEKFMDDSTESKP